MAAAAVKQHSRKGRRNHKRSIFRFLCGCFGNSGRASSDQHRSIASNRVRSVGVVMDRTSSEIVGPSREIHVVEEEEERIQLPAPPAAQEVLNNELPTHDIIMENKENLDESKQHTTEEEGWSQPTELSHSLPPRRRKAPAAGGKGKRGKESMRGGEAEFGSTVGAVIVMVTLIVMLIWGKVCAILCTAAWLYFIPRFRTNMNESSATEGDDGGHHMDLDSREYKKKVVLQGLLERNQQIHL